VVYDEYSDDSAATPTRVKQNRKLLTRQVTAGTAAGAQVMAATFSDV